MSITSHQHQGARRSYRQTTACAAVQRSTGSVAPTARRTLITSNLLQTHHLHAKALQPAADAHSGGASQNTLASLPIGLFSPRRAVTTVGATTTPSSASTAPAVPEEFPVYQHRVWSPLATAHDATASLDGPNCNDALLVIVPGAFLTADAFQPLVAALQAASPRSRLWVTVLNLDAKDLLVKLCGPNASFQDLGPAMDAADGYNKLLNQAVDQAVQQGFGAQRERGVKGRIANMVMLCQSAGAFMAPLAARTAAATILLACTPNVEEYYQQNIISLEAWPRPLMILSGELDGQMRWPWLSPYIAESAVLATKLGPRLAATTKPVLVLPGINHGNTSNGEMCTARGDIQAGVAPYDTCIQMLAASIVPFIAVHTSTSKSEREQASNVLLAAVRETAQLAAPYCRAAGLGDPTAPYTTRPHDPPPPPYGPGDTGPLRVGRLVAGTQRVAATSKSSALSPGAVVAAEAAAVAAQMAVLSGLPAAERERLRVVATAHTDVETFLYSHPEMEHVSGDLWVLHVHVLMHFRCLDGPGLATAPAAPDYTLKLRNAAFVAAMLGLPQPSQYPTPRPAALHNLTLEAALAAVPPAVAQRYRTLGRTLQFGDDIDVLVPGPDGTLPRSPEVFVRQSRITFTYPPRPDDECAAPAGAPSPFARPPSPPPPGPVRVSSPYLVVLPPDGIASRSRKEARYTGVFYTKLMSLAQIIEWVWVDCLREAVSPW